VQVLPLDIVLTWQDTFYIIITFNDFSDTLADARDEPSKFKLRFHNERTQTYYKMLSTKILTRDESTNVSFPESNAADYTNNSTQLKFISPGTEKPFHLTVTFQDNEKVADFVKSFFIEDKKGGVFCTFKLKDTYLHKVKLLNFWIYGNQFVYF